MKIECADDPIALRPFQPADTASLYEAVCESINQLSQWMAWSHPNYSMEDSRAFVQSRGAAWEKGEHYSFVVQEASTGRFLGGVGLNFPNRAHNFANLGYWVRTSSTGRGIATMAARLAARFGFEKLQYNRIEIVTACGNRASQRVAEKAGAKQEGVLRRRLVLHGKPLDAVMYSLVPEDLGR
jgi:RimJ/RimL family protein N-acetyltransferase